MPIKAIIFDCDGTLIDSEEAHLSAWRRTLQNRGHDLTLEQCLFYTGKTASKFSEMKGQESMKAKDESKNILKYIKPDEALGILTRLCESNKGLIDQIQNVFLDGVSQVDIEAVANELLMDLEGIDVEDLWDRSGSKSEGYVGPGDEACNMVDEVIESYIEEMKRYRILRMYKEEMLQCMGIVSGLLKFENESDTEFKDWACDMASSAAVHVLDDWRASCQDPELKKRNGKVHKRKSYLISKNPNGYS